MGDARDDDDIVQLHVVGKVDSSRMLMQPPVVDGMLEDNEEDIPIVNCLTNEDDDENDEVVPQGMNNRKEEEKDDDVVVRAASKEEANLQPIPTLRMPSDNQGNTNTNSTNVITSLITTGNTNINLKEGMDRVVIDDDDDNDDEHDDVDEEKNPTKRRKVESLS